MKKFAKLAALALAVVMALALFTACGEQEDSILTILNRSLPANAQLVESNDAEMTGKLTKMYQQIAYVGMTYYGDSAKINEELKTLKKQFAEELGADKLFIYANATTHAAAAEKILSQINASGKTYKTICYKTYFGQYTIGILSTEAAS